jgi:hypothetical protein
MSVQLPVRAERRSTLSGVDSEATNGVHASTVVIVIGTKVNLAVITTGPNKKQNEAYQATASEIDIIKFSSKDQGPIGRDCLPKRSNKKSCEQ